MALPPVGKGGGGQGEGNPRPGPTLASTPWWCHDGTMPKNATGNARVRMPESLHAQAIEVAASQGVSLNEFLVRATERAVLNEALTEGALTYLPQRVARYLVEYDFILDHEDCEDFLLLARERALNELVRTGAQDVQVRTLRVFPDRG